MTAAVSNLSALYRPRRDRVEFVDVPELAWLMVDGAGPPEGDDFASAVQALNSVSYGAHFALKKERGEAPKVMPLEAQWWVDDPDQQDIVAAVALGQATMHDSDRALWRWRAMIVQPDPVDAATITRAARHARETKDLPAVQRLRYERWEEGRCAQLLHVGPYAEEGRSLARLHQGIAAAGCRPRGRHHEVYLGDPRRSAPERLRTILRHPVEPATPSADPPE